MKNLSQWIVLLFWLGTGAAYAQPANDDCIGVQTVLDNGACVGGTTVLAADNWSGLVGCQSGAPNGVHEDVWYNFTATFSSLSIDVTAGAGWAGDLEVSVWLPDASGCAGFFTLVASNCGASPVNVSTTGLIPGQQYFITVSNEVSGTPGAFTICTQTTSPPVNCTDNLTCATAAVITLNPSGQSSDPAACVTDCNTGAGAGIDGAGNNCYDSPNPTVWYQFTTDAGAATLNISMTSADLSNPEFTIWTNCPANTYIGASCTEGAGGSAVLTGLGISANTTYYIAISDVTGDQGNFTLCINQILDQSLCNTGGQVTETGSSNALTPVGGPYSAGEVVSFCYTIDPWEKLNCNWLQGIVPTFGNCWAPSSFLPSGMPATVTTPLVVAGNETGSWNWYLPGAVTYNNIIGSLPPNSPMPAGWYFQCNSCGVSNADPDLSWGDGGASGSPANDCDPAGNGYTWTVCFSLIAGNGTNCGAGQTDCSVTFKTYADGEIGGWSDVGCTGDLPDVYPAAFLCCPSFVNPGPLTGCDNLTLPAITGTLLTGSEQYWTGTGGSGTAYPGGTVLQFADFPSYPQTLYIYDPTSCGIEVPVSITIQQTPNVFDPADIVGCGSVQFPAITGTGLVSPAYYSGSGGTGTQYAAGSSISTSGTYYLYDTSGGPSNCFDQESFTINVVPIPVITNPGTLVACDSVQLPVINGTNLTAGVAYFSGPGGTGTQYGIGDWITASGTYYIYNTTGAPNNCSDEEMFTITVNTTPVITLTPNHPGSCGSTDGSITVNGVGTGTITWTGTVSGNSGAGQALPYNIPLLGAGGYVVTFTSGATGCTSAPILTGLNNPGAPVINAMADTSSCQVNYVIQNPVTSITGSALTGNQAYYSAPGGNIVNLLPQGTVITAAMSPFTVYMYDNNGSCSSEVSFVVNVSTNPSASITPDPIGYCVGSVVNLNGNPLGGSGVYSTHVWTGSVAILNATSIVNPSTINSATAGAYNLTYTVTDNIGCVGSDNITITIVAIPNITNPGTLVGCGSVQLPAITGTNLTAGVSYYSGSGGTGTAYSSGASISTSGTYYIYDNTGGLAACSDQESFTITVSPTPVINNPGTLTACDSLQLPAITGTNLTGSVSYYTGAGGTGIALAPGSWLFSSTPLYIYDNTGAPTNCSDEEVFNVVINATPTALPTSFTTPICEGQDIELLGNTVGVGATYQWTGPDGFASGLEDPIISSATTVNSGTYNLQITLNGCTSPLETVDIVVIVGPVIDPMSDVVACESYTLPAITGSNLSGNQAYFDNSQVNGGLLITGPITTSQTVWMYDAVAQCSSEESFVVTINSLPTVAGISGGGVYCQGDLVSDVVVEVAGAQPWTVNYTLNGTPTQMTGATTPIVLGSAAGTYVLQSVDDANCSNSASGTETIVINAIPIAPTAGTDAEYCSTVTYDELTASGNGGVFTWYSDAALANVIGTGTTLQPTNTVGQTVYYVTETLNGCEGPSSQVLITVNVCDIIIPSAFTPGTDSAHDDWEIYNLTAAYPNHIVTVYNRWGTKLYESSQGGYDTDRWDGTYNGELLPVASYYYIIEFNDEEKGSARGTVSLIYTN